MGKATADSNNGAGSYEITLIYDTRRVDQRITDLTDKLADAGFLAQITAAQLDRDQAKVDLANAQADLDALIDDFDTLPSWAASTDYVNGWEIKIGVSFAAKSRLAGRSGSTAPTWSKTHGDLIRENFVRWTTFDSGVSLGHPSWTNNNDYTTGDNITTTYSPSPSLTRYATAQTDGRSGSIEPSWGNDGDLIDGGIIWQMYDFSKELLERAREVMEAQKVYEEKQLEYDRLRGRQLAMQKELAYLQSYKPTPPTQTAWCADYVTDIADTTEVASCEINGDRRHGVNIRARKPPHHRMIDQINDYREGLGFRRLWPDYRLYVSAQRHADDMAAVEVVDQFQHEGTDGSSFQSRARDAGYPLNNVIAADASNIGEVIGAANISGWNGYGAVFAGWQGSAGHDAVMKDPRWTHIGVAYTSNPDGVLYTHTWCVTFGYIDPLIGGNWDYDRALPGIVQPSIAGTPAAVYYNMAMMPGWQKWRPTYRVGTLLAIDRDENTGTVVLDAAQSGEVMPGLFKKLDISNHPTPEAPAPRTIGDVIFRYMCCDNRAFCVGDRVLVEHAGQHRDYPYIVGFESNPKPCAVRLKITRGDGRIIEPDADLNVDIFLINEDRVTIGGGFWSGTDVDPPPINPGFSQELDFDSTTGEWLVYFEDTGGERCASGYYLSVSTDDSIETQYPFAYKSCDKWAPANLQTSICEPVSMQVPYWRVEQPDQSSDFITYEDSHVQRTMTVYSSIPYQVTYEWRLITAVPHWYGISARSLGCSGAFYTDCDDAPDDASMSRSELTNEGGHIAKLEGGDIGQWIVTGNAATIHTGNEDDVTLDAGTYTESVEFAPWIYGRTYTGKVHFTSQPFYAYQHCYYDCTEHAAGTDNWKQIQWTEVQFSVAVGQETTIVFASADYEYDC